MTDAHAQGPMEQWVRDPTNIRHHLGEGGYLTHERCGGSCKVIEAARQQDDIQRQLVEALEGCFVLGQELAGLVCGEYCAHSRDDPEDCPRNDPRLEIARAALARVREEGR